MENAKEKVLRALCWKHAIRDKQIKDLETEIFVQEKIMEGLAIKKGENIRALYNLLEARSIELETQLEKLESA